MARRTTITTASLLVAASLGGTLVACSDDGDTGNSDGRLVVAAAFYPLAEIARTLGGDAVQVVTIVPPGEEAHEYEPTPKQLTALEDADVVLYLGDGFQPSVEKAIQNLPDSVVKLDLLEGLTLLPLDDGNDPHVWLDPLNMQLMTATVEVALAEALPAEADGFSLRATAYHHALATLDEEFNDGLLDCANRYLVTGHEAFGYLAAAYGLTQESIAGISPGDEPSARTLEDVSAFVREHDITTIFFEENLPDDLARTVADETGATTAVLNTVETLSDEQVKSGATYASVMRDNLTALRAASRCA